MHYCNDLIKHYHRIHIHVYFGYCLVDWRAEKSLPTRTVKFMEKAKYD